MFKIFDLEEETINNKNFRKVIDTKTNQQLVLMSLKPLENIPPEIHKKHDQFIKIEKGVGKVIINGTSHPFKSGYGFIIPAGTEHEIINTSAKKYLKLYSIYSPPEHKPGRIDKIKPKN
jgi:mannose-6-phosphate isomerase-like protein (cupin superfamily)